MKRLEKLFNELLEHKSSWDYYRSLSLQTEGIYEVFTEAGSFVEAYLAKGSKLDEDTRKYINLLFRDGNRIEHTLSIYFLGILFYEKVSDIKDEVDSYLEYVEDQIDSEYEKTPFSYYWFLICFFHDLGYVFEEYDGSEQIFEMIFSQSEPFNFKLPKPKSGKVVPQVFQKKWWRYFRYRKKENSKIVDHGIMGGILFYNQRKNAYKSKKSIYETESFIDESGLFWSQKILNWIHLSVSWIIIGHNIWFTKRGSSYEELYKSYGLEGLITDKPKISLKRYPLLFLLSLVDSIDPVKQFAKYDNNLTLKEILNNLEFDFSYDSITISSEFEDNEMTKRYIKEVSNLNDWLSLDVESTEKSVILSV